MKIWCDTCNNTEASVFCSADEAALCEDCDIRIHQANKLASKHHRLSLLQPSSSSSHTPQCDICQAKRAMLFCQQDRAILCRECDVSIHSANELTQQHNRFLLTGAKLSLLSTTTSAKIGHDPIADLCPMGMDKCDSTNNVAITHDVINQPSNGEGGSCTSSISEYLMEMLPEWQVEDLLDSSLDPVAFFKDSFNDELLCLNAAVESGVCSNGNEKFRVLQSQTQLQSSSGIFTVPQMNKQPTISKIYRF